MHSKRGLITAGIVVFVAGLISMFPARVAFHWLAPAEVSANGIQGTIWTGSCTELDTGGLYLHDVRWRLKVLHLLTGKLTYKVDANPVSGFLDTVISRGLGNTITLTSLTAALPIALFSSALGKPDLGGNVSLKFARVDITNGLAVRANGILEVSNLVDPDFGPIPLGSYKAEFITQENGIVGGIEDTDNVVDLAGTLEIYHDRSFKFSARAIPTQATPDTVRTQLQRLSPPNARGQHELRLEGTL